MLKWDECRPLPRFGRFVVRDVGRGGKGLVFGRSLIAKPNKVALVKMKRRALKEIITLLCNRHILRDSQASVLAALE